MSLFGSGRDANLIRRFNREVVNRILDIEVIYYKLALDYVEQNIYNESSRKVFYDPIRLNAIIRREFKQAQDTEQALEFGRSANFFFLRDDLIDLQVVMSEGDYIVFDEDYYELDNVYSDNHWFGKNPDTDLAFTNQELKEFGYNVSVVARGHLTRKTNLPIREYRSGINDIYKDLNKL